MNIYNLTRNYYSKVFAGEIDFKPNHASLYFFILNQANRANWPKWVKIPFDTAMQGACINSNKTYYKTLNDLQKFGLINYQKGKNNYCAPKINIIDISSKDEFNIPSPEHDIDFSSVNFTSVKNTPLPTLLSTLLSTHLPTQAATLLSTHLTTLLSTHRDILLTSNYSLVINKNNNNDFLIDDIYNMYPSKCPVKGSSTGKTLKNKDKIKSLIKTIEPEKLKQIISKYVNDCTKDKIYVKNFSTFLNNIPDYSESKHIENQIDGDPIVDAIHYQTTGGKEKWISMDKYENVFKKRYEGGGYFDYGIEPHKVKVKKSKLIKKDFHV